jgi:hypothetical protein
LGGVLRKPLPKVRAAECRKGFFKNFFKLLNYPFIAVVDPEARFREREKGESDRKANVYKLHDFREQNTENKITVKTARDDPEEPGDMEKRRSRRKRPIFIKLE